MNYTEEKLQTFEDGAWECSIVITSNIKKLRKCVETLQYFQASSPIY